MLKSVVSIGCCLIPCAIGACANVPGPQQDNVLERADITVEVDNRNFSDATVYANDGDRSVRLGRVSGKTSGEFLYSGFQLVVPGQLDHLRLVIGVSPGGPITLTGR